MGRRTLILQTIEDRLAAADESARASGRRRKLAPVYLARLVFQVVQQWIANRCPQQAASLAFQAALSFVPALGVALEAIRISGSASAQSRFVDFVAGEWIPVSREELSAQLVSWSKNVTFESLGLIGLVASVFIAFVLYNNLERVANQIWRAERRRSIAQKFVVFVILLTVAPLLIGVSLVLASKVGLTAGWSGFTLSLLTSFGAVFLANFLLPRVRVSVKAALAGAIVTTILFEVAKYGFTLYITEFALERFSGIYGAVAIVPIWLFWIYWSWLMLLLGFEVSHAVQNLRFLESIERRRGLSADDEVVRRVNGIVASRIMVAIARAGPDHAPSTTALVDRFALTDEIVHRIIERLQRAGLVAPADGDVVGFQLSMAPEEITLGDILAVFHGDAPAGPELEEQGRLNDVVAELEGSDGRSENLTLAELAN